MRIIRRAIALSLLIAPLALSADAVDARAKGTTKVVRAKATPAESHETRAKRPAGRAGKRAAHAPTSARRGAGSSTTKSKRPAARPLEILSKAVRCPDDMVAVAGRVCVDRYEMSLVDRATGASWSPFYSPDPTRAKSVAETYASLRGAAPSGSLERMLEIPPPPSLSIEPRAVSAKGVLPQGYVSANQAAAACELAGKRLCTEAEWVTACRGDTQRSFPYGDTYEQGACNVVRENHPSVLLHGNAARFHDDPRNNLVEIDGRPLLRKTGDTSRCASRWGNDAIYDMVGNLDEWVADPDGVFVGGFYSRGTKSGCASRVSAHPRAYSDYSTGARCCADPSEDSL